MKWSRFGWALAAVGVLSVGACDDDSDSSDSPHAGSSSGAKSGAGGDSGSPSHVGGGAGGDSGSPSHAGGGAGGDAGSGGANGDYACQTDVACSADDPIAFLPCPSKPSDLDGTCRKYVTVDRYQACGGTVLVVSNGIQTTSYTFDADEDLVGSYSAGDVGDHACYGDPCLEHAKEEVVCDGSMGYAGAGFGGYGADGGQANGGAGGFAGRGGAGGEP